MNFPLYVAKRYIRSKSGQNAVNIINFVTFLVIVIGSASLFIVLSGFTGLKTYSLSFISLIDPDIKALPAIGKTFSVTPEQAVLLGEIHGIASYSKELEQKVLLLHKDKMMVASIKGVDENYINTIGIDSTVHFGRWGLEKEQGVAGIGISQTLGVAHNNFQNPLKIMLFRTGKGSMAQKLPMDNYNIFPLVLSGLYSVEEKLDSKYVFIDLNLAQALLEKDSTLVSGINFKLNPNVDELSVKMKIIDVLGNMVLLKNSQELNSSLYRMLNTENIVTYLIFTLVLIIALFNVVGAIVMMILDKQQNSITLYSLGMTIKQLRQIYFVQGVLVTTIGGVIGILLGSLLIGLQVAFGLVKIGVIAYPVEFKLQNVLLVLATIIVLGIIASKIASTRLNQKLIGI